MIARTFFFIALFLFAVFAPSGVIAAETGEQLCEIIAPRKFDKLHSIPVSLAVKLTAAADPATFAAYLNGKDITKEFAELDSESSAHVGPQHGLRVNINKKYRRKLNVFKVRVKNAETGKLAETQCNFFLDVDELVTIGSEGGNIHSPDGMVSIKVPPGALTERTPLALTRIRGTGRVGSIYQLSPETISFQQPVKVTMRYDRRRLPYGAREDSLFILTGTVLADKLATASIDRIMGAVFGSGMYLNKFYLSYYKSIGKTLDDIPFTASFRVPIGDIAEPYYGCGLEYSVPDESDVGEMVPLLRVNSGEERPVITFNEQDAANKWQVTTGFRQKRLVDSGFNFPQDLGLLNNGEDWRFIGKKVEGRDRLPIHAAADGLIISSGRGYGNSLILAHQTPIGLVCTVYSHLTEKSLCSEGSIVRKGNIIGMIGGPDEQNPYLHFEVIKQPFVIIGQNGELLAPAHWFGRWTGREISDLYYEPTSFFLNFRDKYKWHFDVENNTEGWVAAAGDKGESKLVASGGLLSVTAESGEIAVVGQPLRINAEKYNTLFFKIKSNGLPAEGKVSFTTALSPGFTENKTLKFDLVGDEQLHEYKIVMSRNDSWRGIVTGLRLDCRAKDDGSLDTIAIDSIRFGGTAISPVPDTGLARCYDDYERSSCPTPVEPFFGQDGNYVINPIQYEEQDVAGGVVVKDAHTGLTWQRRADGNPMNWDEAVEFCEQLSLGEYDDWRLPDRSELQTIVNYSCLNKKPSEEEVLSCFAHPESDDVCYWTANTESMFDPAARKICFNTNSTLSAEKTDANYVLAVRGEPLARGRFVKNNDGTITDLATDLMWQDEEIKSMTWPDALQYASNLRLGGHVDWRMPSIRELASLVKEQQLGPAIDSEFFPGTRPEAYWSSTTHINYPDFAWFIDFKDGLEHGGQKGRRYYVRAVRGGSGPIVIFSGDIPEEEEEERFAGDVEAEEEEGEEGEEEDEGVDEEEEEGEDDWGDEGEVEEEGDDWGAWGDEAGAEEPDDKQGDKVDEAEDDGWGDWGDEAGGDDSGDKQDQPKAKKKSKKGDEWGDWGDEWSVEDDGAGGADDDDEEREIHYEPRPMFTR